MPAHKVRDGYWGYKWAGTDKGGGWVPIWVPGKIYIITVSINGSEPVPIPDPLPSGHLMLGTVGGERCPSAK